MRNLAAILSLALFLFGCASAPPKELTGAKTVTLESRVEPPAVPVAPRVEVTGARFVPKPEVVGEFSLRHKCSKLVTGTQHVPYVVMDLLVRYEESYGASRVYDLLGPLLRPNYAEYCELVGQLSLSEVIQDPVVSGNSHLVQAEMPPQIISVELVGLKVEFSEEFWRAQVLKTLPTPAKAKKAK